MRRNVLLRARTHPNTTYEPTQADIVWLSRAVAAEGKPQALVARALINGYMAARTRGYRKPLATYVRAYAQPVNPRWFPDGDLHLQAWSREPDEKKRNKLVSKAVRRRDELSLREKFSRTTRTAVRNAISVPSPFRATDYAAAFVHQPIPWVQVLTTHGGNTFWLGPREHDWLGYDIVKRLSGSGGAAVVVLILLVGAALALSKA